MNIEKEMNGQVVERFLKIDAFREITDSGVKSLGIRHNTFRIQLL